MFHCSRTARISLQTTWNDSGRFNIADIVFPLVVMLCGEVPIAANKSFSIDLIVELASCLLDFQCDCRPSAAEAMRDGYCRI